MIIQIRGTSGSGKTTVMKQVMAELHPWSPAYKEGRKKPLYYHSAAVRGIDVIALGHYEAACGGCDTIGSAAAVYALIDELSNDPRDPQDTKLVILAEGLLLSEDVKWSKQLNDLRIIYLTTPLEQCIEQIKGRRAEAGNDKPLNVTNTSKRVEVIERSRQKLVELGVVCRRAPTEQAVKIILDWIRNAN